MTTNKDWKDIEEEFRQKFPFTIIDWKFGENAIDKMKEILDFFKPYFQEEMHEKAKDELEHPLYKKEYYELPELVEKRCNNGGMVLASMPPKYKCVNCGQYWDCQDVIPVCKTIKSESSWEDDLTKAIDILTNAISDDNHVLEICIKEEIWKIVYRIEEEAYERGRNSVDNLSTK